MSVMTHKSISGFRSNNLNYHSTIVSGEALAADCSLALACSSRPMNAPTPCSPVTFAVSASRAIFIF